ncbi:2-(5'-triphosphoribosyl)-3'-dephospho CoA synthase [Haemophilus paracuniculus]|uniref:Probable 2-(5''-triphosphoribosyl)-3'-dephosphocoenzyme-A synthase n=1 Tax=Haemophilus paracuniculus TaxID=734 RepID=A0A1T0ASU0_9PAST|nr:triphosphoribosyl-dephospho-CoA synthase CitG [Haemophilus paracuniculus]OOR99285.1 2-(5'-triphosphoribosyl)-3'-dephospho CoA synthase [Haemophilus paracuniculus]
MIFAKICPPFDIEGEAISLETLLNAREARALLQQQCLTDYQQTVLSFTLLAVGAVKKNALLDYVFTKGLAELTALFQTLGIKPTAEFIRPLATGHEAIFSLPIEATTLKRALIALEQSSPLARLWDFDVFEASGRLLSRAEFGLPPRPCLLCNDEGKICTRSRRHSLDEIVAEMQRRVRGDYLAEKIADKVNQALLAELDLTPKPGLVDRQNNGAHKDMDYHTFERSAAALRPFWAKFVQRGIETADLPESQILAEIRPLGQQAEQAMFHATDQINTHKGAIFAFGLVCCAMGRAFALSAETDISQICHTVAQITQGITQELQNVPENQPLTAGIRIFREYGLTGARGEAEAGFPLVRKVLPLLDNQRDPQHQGLILLTALMADNADTNLIHRGGLAGLTFVQNEAHKRLENTDFLQDREACIASLNALDQACIERNLSAGGSADLLALTFFFHLLLRGN